MRERGAEVTIKVKHWDKFQHYKNRRPPWIRLYRDLLDDPDFDDLRGDLVKTLFKLWLAVSEFSTDGSLPAFKKLALRMHMNTEDATNLLAGHLIQLIQWLDCDASTLKAYCQQSATPETETEGEQIREERETETPARARDQNQKRSKTKRKTRIPDDWSPNDAHRQRADDLNLDVDVEAEKFRDHALATGRTLLDWDAGYRNWLTKADEFRQSRPQHVKNTGAAMQSWERVQAAIQRNTSIEFTDHEKRAIKAAGGMPYLKRSTNPALDAVLYCKAFDGLASATPPTPATTTQQKKEFTATSTDPQAVSDMLKGLPGYRSKR